MDFLRPERGGIVYRVLYRKWRPTGFADVIGQPQVTSTLKNEIKSGRISHAYLFTGSRGTGKTTCAKILAKAINCLNLSDGEPCGKCENCLGISSGNILDVVEMDAASNNSVNNIRDVLDEVMFTPSEAKYRVYIIDEVHMLSTGAFNALLKTLEEPPSHVVFILATTEVHKLPATILSRCQRFDFNRIAPEDIADRLEYISSEEGVSIDRNAAMLIAAVADGAMRDALSVLDRCIGLSENITSDTVREATGLAGRDYLFSLADAVKKEDVPLAINTIDSLHKASKSISRLCEELTGHFRTLMLIKTMKKNVRELVILSDEEYQKAQQQADSLTLTKIVYSIDVLQESLERMFKGGNNRIEFETCMIKLCNPRLSTDIGAVIARLEKLERAVRAGINSVSYQNNSVSPVSDNENVQPKTSYAPISESTSSEPTDIVSKNDSGSDDIVVENKINAEKVKNEGSADGDLKRVVPQSALFTEIQNEKPITVNAAPTSVGALKASAVPFEQWEDVLEVMKGYSRVTAAAFRGTTAYVSGDFLFIDANDDTPFSHMRNPSQKEKMRMAIKEVTGRNYKLGPYRTFEKKAEGEHSKLDEFIEKISNSDINVTIE